MTPFLFIIVKMKKKKLYSSPTTDVVKIKTEGILCTSSLDAIVSTLEFGSPFSGNIEVEW